MKRLITIIAITVLAFNSFSQTNTFPANGNVGIGLTNPSKQLQIGNTSNYSALYNDYFNTINHLVFESKDSNDGGAFVFRSTQDTGTTDLLTINRFGNIGIGTNTPENNDGWNKVLNVHGTSHSKIITSTTNVNTGIWSHNSGFYGAPSGGILGTYSNHPISFITNKSAKMTITSSGNIGVGITNPSRQLQIGNISNYSALYNDYLSTVNHMIFESKDSNDGGAFVFRSTKDAGTTDLLTINRFGNVGIGTNTTGTHKLAVDGTIGAREIMVEATGWSDFVFEDNYKLKDLEEVESFINNNKHLPDVPSEKEVMENGIQLGEMDAKLLQKIEELTLYVIEQNKKTDNLIKEVQGLKVENKTIREELKTIKSL